MGLLEKIAAEKKIQTGESAAAQDNPAVPPPAPRPAAPDRPCPVCVPPAGRHFWLDVYSRWECTTCHPPASMAQVRGETLLGTPGRNSGPPAQSWGTFSGFTVLGILEPGGTALWNPATTAREKREILEADAFFRKQEATT